jgi:transcription-repair coupling factor (superfamily II helicase)
VLKQKIEQSIQRSSLKFDSLEGEIAQIPPENLYVQNKELFAALENHHSVFLESQASEISQLGIQKTPASAENNILIDFKGTDQPAFNKKFPLIIERLSQNKLKGMDNYLFCASDQQAKRFSDIFEATEKEVPYKTVVLPIHRGFEIPLLHLACYTDHEIFERYHKFHIKNGFDKKEGY